MTVNSMNKIKELRANAYVMLAVARVSDVLLLIVLLCFEVLLPDPELRGPLKVISYKVKALAV